MYSNDLLVKEDTVSKQKGNEVTDKVKFDVLFSNSRKCSILRMHLYFAYMIRSTISLSSNSVMSSTNSSTESPTVHLKNDFIKYFKPFSAVKSFKHLCRLVSEKIKEANDNKEHAGKWIEYKATLMKVVKGKWDKRLANAKEMVAMKGMTLCDVKGKRKRKCKKAFEKAKEKYRKIKKKWKEAWEQAEEGLAEVKVWYFNQHFINSENTVSTTPKISKNNQQFYDLVSSAGYLLAMIIIVVISIKIKHWFEETNKRNPKTGIRKVGLGFPKETPDITPETIAATVNTIR